MSFGHAILRILKSIGRVRRNGGAKVGIGGRKNDVGDKSEHCAKLDRSFINIGFYLPRTIIFTRFDHIKLVLGTFLSRKSMRAKFDIEGQK